MHCMRDFVCIILLYIGTHRRWPACILLLTSSYKLLKAWVETQKAKIILCARTFFRRQEDARSKEHIKMKFVCNAPDQSCKIPIICSFISSDYQKYHRLAGNTRYSIEDRGLITSDWTISPLIGPGRLVAPVMDCGIFRACVKFGALIRQVVTLLLSKALPYSAMLVICSSSFA